MMETEPQPSVPEQEKNEPLILTQKKFGAFNSFPLVDDVLDVISQDPDQEWEKAAQNIGHQEYIDNVKNTAEFCRQRGLTDRSAVERVLKEATINER